MKMGDECSDKQVRTLCLAIACLPDGETDAAGFHTDERGLPIVNGIIYDPGSDYKIHHPHARNVVDKFFNRFECNEFRRVMVRTQLSPEELADELVDKFGIQAGATYISGITAHFSATNDLAKAILDELAANPDMFNKSANRLD